MKKVLISLIIGVAILVVLFLNIDLYDLSRGITSASPTLVIVSFVIFLCFNTMKAIRWKIIVGKGQFVNFFCIVHIGSLVTIILPSYVQEPIRAALLKKKENIVFGHGLSSIFIERLMDIVGLVFIGIIASLYFPITDEVQSWIFHLIRNIIIFVSLVTGFFIILVLKPKLFSKIFSSFKKNRYLAKLYEKLEALIQELSVGFKEIIKKPLTLIFSFLITILMWMINFTVVYFLFISISFDIEPLIVLFGFVATSLGLALPQAPGFIGTFEIIWLGAFSTLGYENNNEILAAGILYHLIMFAYILVLGIIGLVILRLSIKDALFGYKKES